MLQGTCRVYSGGNFHFACFDTVGRCRIHLPPPGTVICRCKYRRRFGKQENDGRNDIENVADDGSLEVTSLTADDSCFFFLGFPVSKGWKKYLQRRGPDVGIFVSRIRETSLFIRLRWKVIVASPSGILN